MSIYGLIRPALFALDPERAHGLSVSAMALVGRVPALGMLVSQRFRAPPDPVTLFGVTFPNRVGVAAGYDKDGRAFKGLAALGFGHVEVGTVTPRPQGGNPRPRVFRLPEDGGVINRLGFPGEGADAVAARLEGPRPKGLVVGVNIGKNKDTPLEDALEDYAPLVARFAPLADYLVVNVSSPNTPGLRTLQGQGPLGQLLRGVAEARAAAVARLGRPVPVLVKLSPDLSPGDLEDAVGVAQDTGMDGIVVTNTTLDRAGLKGASRGEAGGLSGRPLTHRSQAVIQAVSRLTQGRMPLIAVGGIMTPEDARRRIDAGASLVQVYTGMIYAGPGLGRDIARGLLG